MDNLRHKVADERFSRTGEEDSNERRPKARNSARRINERAVSKRRALTGISRRNSPRSCLPPANFSRAATFFHATVPATCTRARRTLLTRFPFHPSCFAPPLLFSPTLPRHIPLRLAFAILSHASFALSRSVFSYANHLFVCSCSLTPRTPRRVSPVDTGETVMP